MDCNKNITVRCLYCKFHRLYDASEKNFSYDGYCLLKDSFKSGADEICEDFKIKPEIHTKKYYPGKK